MNTQAVATSAEIQAAFRQIFAAPDEANALMEAFEVFVNTFLQLKKANEDDRKVREKEFATALKEMRAKVAALKPGTDGKTPRAGVDYPSRAQFAEIMEAMRPKTPVLGEDYFVPTKEEIVAACMQMLSPADILGMLFKAPDNVILAINDGESQIKPERIEGLEQLIKEVRTKHWPPFFAGAGAATAITNRAIVGEVVSFSGVTGTLAQTPVVGSFALYRGGVRLSETEDYTRSGVTITLNSAAVSGEVFAADYSYAV